MLATVMLLVFFFLSATGRNKFYCIPPTIIIHCGSYLESILSCIIITWLQPGILSHAMTWISCTTKKDTILANGISPLFENPLTWVQRLVYELYSICQHIPLVLSQPSATCILKIARPTCDGCEKFQGRAIRTGCSSVWKIK